MKINEDKCYLLVVGHKNETMWAHVGCSKIWESHSKKLLRVIIDRNLMNMYLMNICYPFVKLLV